MIDAEVPESLMVTVCSKVDVGCSNDRLVNMMQTEEGLTAIRFRTAAEQGVFFRVMAPDDGLFDLYYQFRTPIVRDTQLLPIRMFAVSYVPLLVNLAASESEGLEVDENASIVIARTFDCQGNKVPNVAVQVRDLGNPDTNFLHFSILSGDTPDINVPITDENGLAGIANATPGTTLNLRGVLLEERRVQLLEDLPDELPFCNEGSERPCVIVDYPIRTRSRSAVYANIDPRPHP